LALAIGLITTFAMLPKKTASTDEGGGVTGEVPVGEGEDIAEISVERTQNIVVIFDYLNETVIKRTTDYVYPARLAVETTARVLNRHTSIVDDLFWEQYCTDMLRQYPQIDNFYIADPKGSRIMASRLPDGIEIDIIDRRAPEPIYIKKRGNRVTSRMTEKELVEANNGDRSVVYDPRVRPWYKKAVKSRALCWSDVYIFASGAGDQQPGFTVSSPTHAGDGRLLFVTAADYVVQSFSEFLRERKVGINGLSFIVNGQGDLIAHPDAAKVVRRKGKEVALAPAVEVLPPWARPAMKQYAEKPERIFLFDHDGRRYIASFTPFLPASGNGWLIVVIVPEEEFFNIDVGERDR
jgi:hypothetical protein